MTPSPRTFVPPPRACATLETIVTQAGGEHITLSPKTTTTYPLPIVASAELREYLRATSTVELGPTSLSRVPGGRVFGSGNVLSPDGTRIARDVSPDFGKPFDAHWLLSYAKIPPPRRLHGATAVVATTLGHGYAHWLLEELPRWIAIKDAPVSAAIAHTLPAFSRMARSWSARATPVIEADRGAHFECDELWVPSVPQAAFPSASTVTTLNAFVAPHTAKAAGAGERLYISRSKSRRRRVLNEEAVWSALEPRGFARLQLEELDWATQIAAFRGARIIVAPHGAGLANLVFSAPGTRVVELFNPRYVDGSYWRLAAVKGLDYRPIVSASAAALGCELTSNRSDIEADVAQLVAAIEAS